MEERRHHYIHFDKGRVAGVFDDDGNLILDVDKVIIRADDVVIVKNEDDDNHDRKHHDDHDDGRRENRRNPFWFY
ncbi:hypothetical protein [Bacillus tuaregi]|uniref:hypothetical protein n=1 Tax=Bacillus tuaregi TaxID=1816695 RepID=UPI0008F8176C|nr:hypothetical protein [Bacillus tuaregi]